MEWTNKVIELANKYDVVGLKKMGFYCITFYKNDYSLQGDRNGLSVSNQEIRDNYTLDSNEYFIHRGSFGTIVIVSSKKLERKIEDLL